MRTQQNFQTPGCSIVGRIACGIGYRSMPRRRTAWTMGKKIEDGILDELPKGCERPEDLRASAGR